MATPTSDAGPDPSRRRIRLWLAAVAALGALALGGGATAFATHRWSDVPDGSWVDTQASWLADNGIASGYQNGTFKPNARITRAQVGNWLRAYHEELGGGGAVTVATLIIDVVDNTAGGNAIVVPGASGLGQGCGKQPFDTVGTPACNFVFPVGTVATPSVNGAATATWADDAAACGTDATCPLTMDTDKSITVTLDP